MKNDIDLKQFFIKMPETRRIFEEVREKIFGHFGSDNIKMKIQKTQISFYEKKSFAYVWLPLHKMKNRPDVYIVLSFGLDHKIESLRIIESVESRKNRWMHHVIIKDSSDADDEIMRWLDQAYKFSLR